MGQNGISAVNAQVVHGTNDWQATDGSSWFVSTVKNEKKVASAKWMTAGLGIYELYLNGRPVGNEFLKLGFTYYAKTKRSFTYDVSDAFNAKSCAENVLSAQVTPVWWGDNIITPGGYDGMIGRKRAFCGVLELTYSDGQEMTVNPGETLVVDFGQNCAGAPSFVFKAAEGTTLS